jgi:predicted metal-dependent hydrolase
MLLILAESSSFSKIKSEEITSPPILTTTPTPTTSASSVNDISFKKCKDEFRETLSKLVIKLLQPYMKMDCKRGRINGTDDFKYLARKFTHTIMEIELNRSTKLDELNLNKRVKVKAQQYVSKYMNRFENEYSRKTDTYGDN